MVRFRVTEHVARGEYLVEAVVPSCGNDAALIAVFNSQCAADKFADFMNRLGNRWVTVLPEPKFGDD